MSGTCEDERRRGGVREVGHDGAHGFSKLLKQLHQEMKLCNDINKGVTTVEVELSVLLDSVFFERGNGVLQFDVILEKHKAKSLEFKRITKRLLLTARHAPRRLTHCLPPQRPRTIERLTHPPPLGMAPRTTHPRNPRPRTSKCVVPSTIGDLLPRMGDAGGQEAQA